MMNVCRVCLKSDPTLDICQIRTKKCNDSFADVVLFCLGIKVIQDSNLTTKICFKCYKKTISFNQFKLLALKNDSYLKTNSDNIILNKENIVIKLEETSITSDDNCGDNQRILDIKDTQCLKVEDEGIGDNSDDEFLSVIKEIKYEFIEEKIDGNEVKKRRGRPKKKETNKTVQVKQVCEECGKTFKNLKAHLESHKPRDKDTSFKCTVCDKMFKKKRSRDIHFKRKHLGLKQQCPICDKKVISLRTHHLTMHEKDSLPFVCVSCGKKFLTQTKLNEHMTQHTKDRPYECDVCQKRFRIKLSLTSHKRGVHNKERSHLCQFCSKSFFKKYHLQLHLRSHTKEKPYECTECGKFFSSTSILKNHKMIHSEVKMFSCELCEMTFVKSSYLKIHMLSHIKEKRFPCHYCDVKFHRSDHRRRHEKTAHQQHLPNN